MNISRPLRSAQSAVENSPTKITESLCVNLTIVFERALAVEICPMQRKQQRPLLLNDPLLKKEF